MWPRAALAAALGASRLVSAVGPGGIGKTRLALAVAADVADRFGGTWYADLVPVTDPALLPAAVLAAIGADESSSRPAQDALAADADDAAADAAEAAALLECAAATAKIRTAGGEALRLDRAAAAAHLRAGGPAAASVTCARCAEHVSRFAGMYADLPVAGTVGGLLADARAGAGTTRARPPRSARPRPGNPD